MYYTSWCNFFINLLDPHWIKLKTRTQYFILHVSKRKCLWLLIHSDLISLCNFLKFHKRKAVHLRKFLRTSGLCASTVSLLARNYSKWESLIIPRIIWAIVLNIKDKATGLLHEASLLSRTLTSLVGDRRNARENILHFVNASPTRHKEITSLSVKYLLIF